MVSVHIREIGFYDFLHFHIWSSRAKIDHFMDRIYGEAIL